MRHKGQTCTEAQRARMSEAAIARHARDGFTPEQRRLIGKRTKQAWADPERRARWVASISRERAGRKRKPVAVSVETTEEQVSTRWQKAHGEEFRAKAPEKKSRRRSEAGKKAAITRAKNREKRKAETKAKVAAIVAAAKPILQRVGVKMKNQPLIKPDAYGIIRKEQST